MFGLKLRSWMETHIVRPRKKQNRKDLSSKKRAENEIIKDITEHSQTVLLETNNPTTLINDQASKIVLNSEQMRTQYQVGNNSNNLSSPESAYSTGYSTDGTSPGTFPAPTTTPEYYINIRTGTRYFHSPSSEGPLHLFSPSTTSYSTAVQQKSVVNTTAPPSAETTTTTIATCIASPSLMSPRQRNRIRTNPWVSTNNTNCNCSPLHVAITRQQPMQIQQSQVPIKSLQSPKIAATASPVRRKWSCSDKKQRCMKCNACSRFEVFSSTSSSSLSVSSVHRAASNINGNIMRGVSIALTTMSLASDEEDDRTLNEMMGKYDESYIYEKETDILSDSDPTDCDDAYDDTDADAGREGGDERDPLTDEDFDFIDNGSLEFNIGDDKKEMYVNKGHCTYHNFMEDQSVQLNRRRRFTCDSHTHTPTSSRRRRPSERRSKHTSTKKRRERQPVSVLPTLIPVRGHIFDYVDGSRSAGNTPVSVRRRRAASSVLGDAAGCLSHSVEKPRRNSISFSRRLPHSKFGNDNKLIEFDKEADKKYRELIIEAEHILMAMRTSSPTIVGSPARRSNICPANKRVELLRNEECGGVSPSNTSPSPPGLSIDAYSPKRKVNNNLPVSKLAIAPQWPLHQNVQQHCPQSEPVKRKVYAHAHSTSVITGNDTQITNDSPTAANPVFHRQKLFHTITSLKKNLENQSETLRHVYHGSNSSQRL